MDAVIIPDVLTAVLAVMTGVVEWFVESIPLVIALFWAEGSLTFLGVLAVISVAIGVLFLIFGVISSFLGLSTR